LLESYPGLGDHTLQEMATGAREVSKLVSNLFEGFAFRPKLLKAPQSETFDPQSRAAFKFPVD
jgi:hypothetical protein